MSNMIYTGRTAITMEFDTGDKETFYLNSNDPHMFERFRQFGNRVNEKITNFALEKSSRAFEQDFETKVENLDYSTLKNMTQRDIDILLERIDVLQSIENAYNNAIKEELDRAFDTEVSKVAFKHCEPLATIVVQSADGETKQMFYIEHWLDWFGNELQIIANKNKAAMNKHLSKHNIQV